ncbi:MAG: M15 family metallopeptidase [Clostridium perfringens]|nr:M15 family metallopeptidase [Clostridium perfringens]
MCTFTSAMLSGCNTAYIFTTSNLTQSTNDGNNSFVLSNDSVTYKNSKDNESSKIPVIDSNFSILVNKQNSLNKDYSPKTVVPNVSSNNNVPVRHDIVDAVEELFNDSKKAGLSLILVSGYRSYETQSSIYNNNLKNKGETWTSQFSAKPGQSEHQTGLALDISSVSQGGGLYQSFGETEEGIWLKANCANYGFILRFLEGKEDITGYTYEPWHFRYVGVEVAKYIMENDLTFEEYLKSLE